KRALHAAEALKTRIGGVPVPALSAIADPPNTCTPSRERIAPQAQSEPPVAANKGNVIADGVAEHLDKVREIAFGAKAYLIAIQKREAEATGIPSLKIAFNNVCRYYLGVTDAHKDKVPEGWVRKQTLVNGEGYITEELKTYEEQILGA